MKLIEALKQTKELKRKADDIRKKIATFCAYVNLETPTYPDQKKQVSEWCQSHRDMMQKIAELKLAIARTNLATMVTIELGGKQVTKSIAEWVVRRQETSELDLKMWKEITDRNLREGFAQNSMGNQVEVKIVRCYDPQEKDKMVDMYSEEPNMIDQRLEIANAVTELI